MATISVPTSANLSAITYAARDTIDVLDGATLTIDSQWTIKPALIQLLGTGRAQAINLSTSSMWVLEFDMGAGGNSGGFLFTQNAQVRALGNWIVVGTSTGANNQVLFNCNSVGGQAIDYPTYIEVETGNATNVWEVWQAIPEDVPGGTANTLGFNAPNTTAGTVAVAANGTVTGTGTAFTSSHPGMPFKLPGIARDFVVATFSTATSIVIQELDGSTYTGGVIAAGSTYILRTGSLISPSQVGSGDLGKVLFFNPLTGGVRMGDGVNGTKLLSGARVRIPNIQFNSARQQTTLATAITGTGAQAFTLAAAIGPASAGTYNATTPQGTLLLINGSNVERIFYSSRSGAVVSATGMSRGAAGTVAQASFPVGTQVYWIPTNQNNTNNAAFNPSPSGSVDLQVCSVGLRMNATFSNFGSMVVKKFGYATIFNAGNCSGTFDVDGISCLGAGFQNPLINGGIAAQFSALLGVGSIKNVNVTNNLPGATSYSNIALGNVQGLEAAEGYRSRHFGRATNANGSNLIGVSFQTVKCATPIAGVYAAGSSVRWNTLTDLDTANIHISALPNANSLGSGDTFIPINGLAVIDSTIRDIRVWDGGLATKSSLISVGQDCFKLVCHNKGSPVINGGEQISSIIADVGLNTTLAHFSVSNPRITTFAGVLSANVAFGRGGRQVMNLINSIQATGLAGSGQQSKGGLEIDVMAGPYRTIQTNPAGSVIPNLTDVQPIVVMSNLDKTVGSVYVGAFTAEGSFDMYDLIGNAYLDNLGRILYPGIGDGVVIKSVYAIKGISNFTGSAFDFNYNLGAGTNPVPAGTTLEFRLSNWGTANTGAWLPFVDNASLETARAALTGFSSSKGVDLQLRIIGSTAQAGRYLMSLRFPATIDASYDPPVGFTQVGVSGAQAGTLVAGYLNAEPSAPELEASLTLTGSEGSVPMPYDYDNVPVDYRLVARKAGWTFSSLTGTYKKTAISIPITQLERKDINGAALYAPGVTGVTVNHTTANISTSGRPPLQIWSAVQDDACLLANALRDAPFETTNGSAFTSTYSLSITSGALVGNISTSSGITLSGGATVGAAVLSAAALTLPPASLAALTNADITGPIACNTNTPQTITLTDSKINTSISNSGTGLLTINLLRSTIAATSGNIVVRPVTDLTLTGLTAGSKIYVADSTGAEVEYVASSGTSYTRDTTGQAGEWTYVVAKYGLEAKTGKHYPAVASTTASGALVADVLISQANEATVIAYAALDTGDKLSDYAAYYKTTQEGIKYPRVITKAGTSPSAGDYDVVLNDTGNLWLFDGETLSIFPDYSLKPGAILTGPLFTSGTVSIPAGLYDTAITANVLSTYPSDHSGVRVTGNFTYDVSDPFPFYVTYTDGLITGTVRNIGTSDIIITKVNTTLGTLGARVTARQFATLTIGPLVAGSDVVIKNNTTPDGSGSNVIQVFDAITETSVSYTYIYQPSTVVNISVYKPGYKDAHALAVTLSATSSTLPISQIADRAYA